MSTDRTQRHHRWLDTQLHRRTRELVEFARRNGCGKITIDAKETPSGLPIFILLERVKQKAKEYGMVVTVSDGEIKPPDDSASGDLVSKTP